MSPRDGASRFCVVRAPNGVSARSKASSVAATVRLVGAQSTTSKTSDFRSYQGPNQGPATSLPSRPMPALPRRSASSGAADSTLASTRLGYRYAGLERFSGRPRVYEGGQPPSSSSSAASSAFCLSQGAPPLPERQALTVTTLLTNPVSLACLPRFRCHTNGCRLSVPRDGVLFSETGKSTRHSLGHLDSFWNRWLL